MSHFTCLVIGENPADQLEPFSEHLEIPEYKTKLIGAKEKNGFIKFYTKHDPKIDYGPGTIEEAAENKKLSFDQLYEKYGEDWNSKAWKKNEKGRWAEYSTYNPNSHWDWHTAGGRWTGYFKLKHGATGITGSPGLMTKPAKAGWVDMALKKDIDFKFMENEAAKSASDKYDIAMKIFGSRPKNKSWDSMIETVKGKHSKKKVKKIDKLKESYWNQPRCKAWSIEEKRCRKLKEEFPFGFFTSPDEFLISKKDYTQNARNSAVSTFAVLKDGKWYEKGEMGFWGISHNEKDKNKWNEEFVNLLISLPDDTLLSLFDCHI